MRRRLLMRLTLVAAVWLAISTTGVVGQSRPTVIKGKKIYTVTKGIIENGVILIQEGKIKDVGKAVAVPPGADEHSAEVVIPGLVDAHTHLALRRMGGGGERGGTPQPITSEWKAVDNLDLEDPMLPIALSGGVTTIMTGSGSGIVSSGQSTALKLRGRSGASKVLKPYVALKMAVRTLINIRPGFPPATEMGWYAIASEQFRKAQVYNQEWADYKAGKTKKPPQRDERLEAFAAALRGDVMVHVHAFYPSEIEMVMELAKQFGFLNRLSFAHVTEAFPIADIMAKNRVYPVIGYPTIMRYWGDSHPHNLVKELMDAGVMASIETDQGGEQEKCFREYGSMVIRHGATEAQTLEALTINGAKALMLADRIGSIEPGKDADLVLMDGPPFDLHAERVEKVFVEGVLEYERKDLRQKDVLTSVGPFKPLKAPLKIDSPSFALTSATVFTVSHGVVRNMTMIVRDGKIAQLEAGAVPAKGMTIVDLGGRVVAPGWVTSRVFPNDWTGDLKFQVQNNEELEPIVPEMRVRFSVDPWFPSYEANREIGLTTEHITPGLLNLVGGTGIMAKMRTLDLDVMIRKDPTCMVMSLTNEPIRQFGRGSQIPVTLDTAVQTIRASLNSAKEYLAKPQDPKTYNQRLEAYRPVLKGDIPVVIHANSVDEIHAALKLASEYNLKPIVSGGIEAWKLVDELGRAKVPVILGDSATNMEGVRGAGRRAGFNDQSPLILSRAGVKVGFFGYSGARRGQPTGRLGGEPALNAMWAFRNGVPEAEALRMITLNPAEMFGMADRIGSLDVGKDADFMILEGHPLDYRVLPQVVAIDGEMVYPKPVRGLKATN